MGKDLPPQFLAALMGSGGGSGGAAKWGSITGNITDQTDLNLKLMGKLDIPGKVPGTEEVYRLPYFFYVDQQSGKVIVYAKTITLDNNKTQKDYSLDVPAADVVNDKAGLMTKGIYDDLKGQITQETENRVAADDLINATLLNKVDKLEGFGLAKITLNGEVVTAPIIYAPTTVGQAGQFFGSDGTSTGWFSIASALKFRGSCTKAELATKDKVTGDVWTISDEDNTNYACDGTTWVNIGKTVDLSGYQLKNVGKANAVLVSDADGNIAASTTITTDKLAFIANVKSDIQAQIDGLAKPDDATIHINSENKLVTDIGGRYYASTSAEQMLKGEVRFSKGQQGWKEIGVLPAYFTPGEKVYINVKLNYNGTLYNYDYTKTANAGGTVPFFEQLVLHTEIQDVKFQIGQEEGGNPLRAMVWFYAWTSDSTFDITYKSKYKILEYIKSQVVPIDGTTLTLDSNTKIGVKDGGLAIGKIASDSIATSIAATGTASDLKLTTEKAVRDAVDAKSATWGSITGKLSDQTDLNNQFKKYLPLSGGTMSGKITMAANTVAARSVDNDFCIYCGGTSPSTGPILKFYGAECLGDKEPYAGCFQLVTNKGYSDKQWVLQGLPSGILTWGRSDGTDKRGFLLAGDATKVVGSTTAVTGASDLKSIDIGGTKYNIPEGGSGAATWGSITGTLSEQTDLNAALTAKQDVSTLETAVSGLGFTKNQGDVNTITINGQVKTPVAGMVDLGNYITDHQSLADYAKKSELAAIIDDTMASPTTTWSSDELKMRFAALAGGAKVEIVETRPETGVLNTLYYVGATSPYHIWLYANNSSAVATWFDMGTTSIDLSGYYTKEQADAKFLSLSGGTMSGAILVSGDLNFIKHTTNNSYVNFCGGTTWNNGAMLQLAGKEDTTIGNGCFQLNAMTSESDRKKFIGKPDGTLSWDGLMVPVIRKKVFSGKTDANGFISASDLGVNQIPIGFSMDGSCEDDPILYLFISSANGTYHRLKCMSWNGVGLNNRYVKGTIYYIAVVGV